MKGICVLLFMFFATNLFAQKYFELKLTQVTGVDSCDSKIQMITHGLKKPMQVIMNNSSDDVLGAGSTLSGICPGQIVTIDVQDSNCVAIGGSIFVDSILTRQIWFDTVMITMPTGPCNGSLSFHFHNIDPTYTRQFHNYTGSYSVPNDSVFTGLCPDIYYYSISNSSYGLFTMVIDLKLATPTPCDHYDFDVALNAAPACDGSIQFNPTVGAVSDYTYAIWNHEWSPVNTTSADNFALNLCAGLYRVRIEPIGFNRYFYILKNFYVDSLISDTVWGVPEIVPAGVDTIIVPSIYNCGFDYSIPLDTVYIQDLISVGGSFYEFNVVVIQGPDTIILNESASLDTSLSFFISLTIYCDTASISTRSGGSEFNTSGNLIYFGDMLYGLNIKDKLAVSDGLELVPNPADTKILISQKKSPIKNIEVFDMNGKLMYSVSTAENFCEIDIENWPNSVYLVKAFDKKDAVLYSKFIKM